MMLKLEIVSAPGLFLSLSPAIGPLETKAGSFVRGPPLVKATHLSWPLWGRGEGIGSRYVFMYICVGHEH